MSAFTLDTSGAVMCPSGSSAMPFVAFQWSDLSPFAQGYVEAAFASAWADASFRADWFAGYGVGGNMPSFQDLAPATLAVMLKDCEGMTSPPHVFANTSDAGRFCWERRQDGWRGVTGGNAPRDLFPPVRLSLSEDGKIVQKSVA